MIYPVGHKILVKVEEADLKTDWGFEVVSENKRLENAAQIIGELHSVGSQAWKAFGPDFSGEPWAKVGDKVLFAKYAGEVVTDPETEEQYRMMNDDDIIAVVTE